MNNSTDTFIPETQAGARVAHICFLLSCRKQNLFTHKLSFKQLMVLVCEVQAEVKHGTGG